MSNYLICKLQVKNYVSQEPQQIPFDDFLITFRNDSNESNFNLNEHSTSYAVIKATYQKTHDVKFLITIQNEKEHSLIGISNFTIPYKKIKEAKTNNIFTYSKECTLIMTEPTKRKLFGNLFKTNSISLVIEAECKSVSKVVNKSMIKSNSLQQKTNQCNNNMNKYLSTLSPKTEGSKKPLWLTLDNYNIQRELNSIKTPPGTHIKQHKSYFEQNETESTNPNKTTLSTNNNNSSSVLNVNNKNPNKKNSNSFSCKSTLTNTIGNTTPNSYRLNTKNSKFKAKQTNYPMLYKAQKNPSYKKFQMHKINNSNIKERDFHSSRGIKKHCLTERNELNINLSDDNIHNITTNYNNNNISYLNNSSSHSLVNAIVVRNLNPYKENDSNNITKIEQELKDVPFKIKTILEKENNKNKETTALRHIVSRQIRNLILYQKLYKCKLMKYINEKKNLQITLDTVCSQYQTSMNENNLLKQSNHLTQIDTFILQSQNTKHNLYNNLIQTTQNELKLFQHIFTKFYFTYDLMKYQESEQVHNLTPDDKLNLLFACARGLIKTYGTCSNLIHSIPQSIKSQVKALFIKNNIKENGDLSSNPTTGTFVPSKIKVIDEEDENEEEDEDSNEEDVGNTNQLKGGEEEEIEKVITTINYNLSKKGKKNLFKKVKGNEYLYGNQQFTLKLEDSKQEIKIIQNDNSKCIGLNEFLQKKQSEGNKFSKNKKLQIFNSKLKNGSNLYLNTN